MSEPTKGDRPWTRPRTREARNKQRDLQGGIANAVAIALAVTAFAGAEINPALADMSWLDRGRLLLGAVVFHLIAY